MSEPRQMLIDGVEPLPSAWTDEPDRVYILSNGLGTNSLAILAGIVERGLPLHGNVFANTENERPEIYENIPRINEWCERHGLPPIEIIRGQQPQQVRDGSLLNECLRLRTMPSKAFGRPSCSLKWKTEPQMQHQSAWAAERGIYLQKITRLLGFDADEHIRVHRGISYDHTRLHKQGYPLYEWGWTREDCIAAIQRVGLPQPGKSACFYCPSSKKHEILDLRAKHPNLLEQALQMERIALSGDGKASGVAGLGRSFNWAQWLQDYDNAASKGEAFLQAQRDLLSDAGIPEADCACADGTDALS